MSPLDPRQALDGILARHHHLLEVHRDRIPAPERGALRAELVDLARAAGEGPPFLAAGALEDEERREALLDLLVDLDSDDDPRLEALAELAAPREDGEDPAALRALEDAVDLRTRRLFLLLEPEVLERGTRRDGPAEIPLPPPVPMSTGSGGARAVARPPAGPATVPPFVRVLLVSVAAVVALQWTQPAPAPAPPALIRANPRDTRAAEELRAAAAAGDADAANDLGVLLARDPARADDAARWLRRSAVGGSVVGQRNLARCLATGALGLAKDEVEADAWFRRAGPDP